MQLYAINIDSIGYEMQGSTAVPYSRISLEDERTEVYIEVLSYANEWDAYLLDLHEGEDIGFHNIGLHGLMLF